MRRLAYWSDWRESIESEQRRALSIIEPDYTYEQALADTGLETLHARCEWPARSFYQKVFLDLGTSYITYYQKPRKGIMSDALQSCIKL